MRRVNLSNREYSQTRALLRFGVLAVFAGFGAGCSADAVRLTEPLFTSSTANQRSIVPQTPVPPRPTNIASANSGVIERQPLPQPGAAPGAPSYSTAAPAPVQTAEARPKPYTPPKPYAASGQPKPLGVVPARTVAQAPQSGGSGTYVVKSGDSLWSIANRTGTTVSALQSANNLSGNAIRPGQRLALPSGAAAPVKVAAVEPTTMNDASTPAAVPNPAPVRRPVRAEKPVAAVQPSTPKVNDKPVGYTPPSRNAAEKPAAPAAGQVAAKPAEPVRTASTGGSGFRWPVNGRVISGFGKKPNGERNDGIDLAVPEGTNVKAAESGVVIYAGNELKSYGNLVLVRHENGWVSAYAHNKELLVKRGDQVQRGQVISLAGRTGGVDSPQVHFELRKGATPVDPMQHLSEPG
jgi:murein DD-endopeptidase MepM/ murein hydrolase activator NlpD